MSSRWTAACLSLLTLLLAACGSSSLTGSTYLTSARQVPASSATAAQGADSEP